MIINIRGTSGSGKSTIVRTIMSLYDQKARILLNGRKQPIGYILGKKDHKSLFVIGHYETNCGGCDTITEIPKTYELIREAHNNGHDVLYEGLLLSAEIKKSTQLFDDGYPVSIIGLNTSIEECLYSVNKRRRETFEKRLEKAIADKANLVVAIEQQNLEKLEAVKKLNEEREAAGEKPIALPKLRKVPYDKLLPTPRGDVKERNTIGKHRATILTMEKLLAKGMNAVWCNREEAVLLIKRELQL